MNELCVIIPVYKTLLDQNEILSVDRSIEILHKYNIYFVVPDNMDITFYNNRYPNIQRVYFDSHFFESTRSYNLLMLSEFFYKKFDNYKYMLIAQPDTYITKGLYSIEYFLDLEYDYIGAPWVPGLLLYRFGEPYGSVKNPLIKWINKPITCIVGNGGFSLRKISSTVNLLKKKRIQAKLWGKRGNEDAFFSYYGFLYNKFKIAPLDIAKSFSLEVNMEEHLSKGEVPFAVHAWEKWLGPFEVLQKYLD